MKKEKTTIRFFSLNKYTLKGFQFSNRELSLVWNEVISRAHAMSNKIWRFRIFLPFFFDIIVSINSAVQTAKEFEKEALLRFDLSYFVQWNRENIGNT